MVVLASRSEILEYFLHHWILLTLSTRQKDESHLQPVGLSQAEVEVEMSCLSLVKCLRFLWNMEQWCIWLKPLDLRQEWKRSGDSSNLSGGERVGIPPGEGAHSAPDETDSSSISCQTTGPLLFCKENDG